MNEEEPKEKKTVLAIYLEGGLEEIGIDTEEKRKEVLQGFIGDRKNTGKLIEILKRNHVMGANLKEKEVE